MSSDLFRPVIAISTPTYRRKDYAETERVYYGFDSEWGARKLTESIRYLHLGPSFRVDRKHIQALRGKTRSLEVLQIDHTGPNATNADVKFIASRNTQLREVVLHRATKVGDKGVIHIVRNCPSIAIIKITGSESGLISGNFAGFLSQRDVVNSHTDLQAIYLEDQPTDESMIKRVSKKWRKLLISTGTTVGSHKQSRYWLGGKRLKEEEERALGDMGYRLPRVEENTSHSVAGPSEHKQSNGNTSCPAPLEIGQADTTMSSTGDADSFGYTAAESGNEKEEDDKGEEEDNEDDQNAWTSDDSDDILGYDPEEDEYNHVIRNGRRPAPVYEPYEPAKVPPSKSLYYASENAWETQWPADIKRTDMQKIQFSENIRVTDTHINAIAAASPEFRKPLCIISVSNGDIHDDAIANLARVIPSLRDISFSDTHSLTDAAIIFIVRNCPDIERISIAGDDRMKGKVNCRGLVDVLEDLTLAKSLRHLELWDQSLHIKSVERISKARPTMAIVEGESVGDGIAAQMVAARTGGGYMHVYLGGRLVDTDGGSGFGDFGYGDLEYEDFGYGDFEGMDLDGYF